MARRTARVSRCMMTCLFPHPRTCGGCRRGNRRHARLAPDPNAASEVEAMTPTGVRISLLRHCRCCRCLGCCRVTMAAAAAWRFARPGHHHRGAGWQPCRVHSDDGARWLVAVVLPGHLDPQPEPTGRGRASARTSAASMRAAGPAGRRDWHLRGRREKMHAGGGPRSRSGAMWHEPSGSTRMARSRVQHDRRQPP